MTSRIVCVHAPHTACCSDALAAQAGETVWLGRRDEKWPGWIWCTVPNGKSGWVPESYLESCGDSIRLRRDYNARELTVAVGEVLTAESEECGWLLCTNARGERGWIPAHCVEPVIE
jgi:hypothetical protein